MKKLIAVTTASIAISVLGAGTATAAHCSGPGDHARATAGNDGHNEGEHQGWSTCVDQSNSDNDSNNRGGNRDR